MASRLLRWGIIGTGQIARTFARDLGEWTSDINQLCSVFVRDVDRAEPFLQQNELLRSRAFLDLDSFASSGIDVCYIATPHTSHVDLATKCLERGLHVLVEKPFAMNTEGIAKVFELASRNGLFVMEALWTRFIPAFERAVSVIREGQIGDVMSADVDFGFDGTDSPARLMDPSLAGGALYDVGSYALHLGTLFIDRTPECSVPKIMHVRSKRRPDGVDEEFAASLLYRQRSGKEVTLNMRLSVVEDTSCTTIVHGKKGYLVLNAPSHSPDSMILNGDRLQVAKQGHGLHYQTREVHACIVKGNLESERVPWNESLAWAETFAQLSDHRVINGEL